MENGKGGRVLELFYPKLKLYFQLYARVAGHTSCTWAKNRVSCKSLSLKTLIFHLETRFFWS